MISLEEEIAKVTKDVLGKDLTPEDIMSFFECETEHIQRLIDIKMLGLKHAQEKYDSLCHKYPVEKGTPLTAILNDVTTSLEIAKLRFEDSKITKSNYLIKMLKIAVSTRQHDVINECLLDLQTLRECNKDLAIAALEEQLLKYSTMAEKEGLIYLDFYSRQEQREKLLEQIIHTKYQLIALNNLID